MHFLPFGIVHGTNATIVLPFRKGVNEGTGAGRNCGLFRRKNRHSIMITDQQSVSFPGGVKAMFKSCFSALLKLPGAAGSDPAVYFSDLPVLETADLILRQVRMSDANDIFMYASDPKVARYVMWEPHRTISDTRAYIRYIRSMYRRGLPSSWAVVHRSSGHVIGSIGFVGYSPVHHTAEVGYSFSREYWNCGFATQALSAVIHSAFDRISGLNRLEAQHDIRNPASGRVMEKCGMRREGVLRGRLLNKAEFIDVVLYAVLRSDRMG